MLPVLNIGIYDVDFSEFLINGLSDQNKYCGDWATNYVIQNAMVVGTSLVVVIINIVVCTFFEKIVSFEKNHTSNDETKGQF